MLDGSTPKRVRRSKAEQRAESLEQILDAAEYLFSINGFYGVTLRDVAQRVGIHTTLLHYYFRDKHDLFEAVFKRRAGVTCDRRMAALERYEAEAGDRPTVEGALHAFLDTDFDLYLEGGEAWMNYAAFCARVSHSREGAEMMVAHFDPVVLKLVSILRARAAGVERRGYFLGLRFCDGRADAYLGADRTNRSSLGRCLPLGRYTGGEETAGEIHGGGISGAQGLGRFHDSRAISGLARGGIFLRTNATLRQRLRGTTIVEPL